MYSTSWCDMTINIVLLEFTEYSCVRDEASHTEVKARGHKKKCFQALMWWSSVSFYEKEDSPCETWTFLNALGSRTWKPVPWAENREVYVRSGTKFVSCLLVFLSRYLSMQSLF